MKLTSIYAIDAAAWREIEEEAARRERERRIAEGLPAEASPPTPYVRVPLPADYRPFVDYEGARRKIEGANYKPPEERAAARAAKAAAWRKKHFPEPRLSKKEQQSLADFREDLLEGFERIHAARVAEVAKLAPHWTEEQVRLFCKGAAIIDWLRADAAELTVFCERLGLDAASPDARSAYVNLQAAFGTRVRAATEEDREDFAADMRSSHKDELDEQDAIEKNSGPR